MKITPRQYAQALYESVEGKSEEKIEAAVKNFARILLFHRQTARLDDIIRCFLRIIEEKEGRIEVKAKIARPLDNRILKEIKAYLIKFLRVREVILSTAVDPNILGGVVIQYKDKIIDGSLRARLEMLQGKMRR